MLVGKLITVRISLIVLYLSSCAFNNLLKDTFFCMTGFLCVMFTCLKKPESEKEKHTGLRTRELAHVGFSSKTMIVWISSYLFISCGGGEQNEQ